MSSPAGVGGGAERADPNWWEGRYLSGDSPWDSGIVPPEVVALIGSGGVARGWALDLGCGSGLTSRYLASHGFTVVGIDFARAALTRGAAGARERGLPCLFVRGNAADFRFARVAATLAVDVGCFHSLTPTGRSTYIDALAAALTPGAHYLLYTFVRDEATGAQDATRETPDVSYGDMAAFAPRLKLCWSAHGEDRGRHSAWYLMRRQ